MNYNISITHGRDGQHTANSAQHRQLSERRIRRCGIWMCSETWGEGRDGRLYPAVVEGLRILEGGEKRIVTSLLTQSIMRVFVVFLSSDSEKFESEIWNELTKGGTNLQYCKRRWLLNLFLQVWNDSLHFPINWRTNTNQQNRIKWACRPLLCHSIHCLGGCWNPSFGHFPPSAMHACVLYQTIAQMVWPLPPPPPPPQPTPTQAKTHALQSAMATWRDHGRGWVHPYDAIFIFFRNFIATSLPFYCYYSLLNVFMKKIIIRDYYYTGTAMHPIGDF